MSFITKMAGNMVVLIPFVLVVTLFVFFALPSLLSRVEFFSTVDKLVDLLAFGWYEGGKSGRAMVVVIFTGTVILLMYSGLRLVGAGHSGAAVMAVVSAIVLPMAAVLWP